MASRPIVSQRAGDEAVAGGVKQTKKNVVANGKSRRALGDIGNLVTIRGIDGKPPPQISRPITRSFCAQLLANAQAAEAAENNKKNVCVNVDKAPAPLHGGAAVGKKAAAPKAVQKKVAVKPQPKQQEVIEISQDTVEESNEGNVPENKKLEGQKSSKKKAQTLTSVLTARSKVACGIGKKPKEDVVDIDASDADNHLAGVEYVEDIYKFYKSVEHECKPYNYMHLQTDINERMRAILVDWLIDVHLKFELSAETLYLMIHIIDQFLSKRIVPRRELQLVGVAAMLIASKYEEIWAPEVNDLVCIADRAYSHEQILVMEKTMLGKLEWNLTVPTHYVFLIRFIKASIPDENMENMVFFLAELGLMHYDTAIMFCPSMVAASAVYVARCTLNKTPLWTETLKLYTGYSETQLMDCAKMLAYFHSKAAGEKLKVVFRKYSNSERGAVALIPPAQSLLSGDAAV